MTAPARAAVEAMADKILYEVTLGGGLAKDWLTDCLLAFAAAQRAEERLIIAAMLWNAGGSVFLSDEILMKASLTDEIAEYPDVDARGRHYSIRARREGPGGTQ